MLVPHGSLQTCFYKRTKRVIDLVIASTGLLLLSPLLLLIAAGIRLGSPGAVLYLGERIGRQGKSFQIVKFRTMQQGSEQFGTTTSKADTRITSLGHFLRTLKLDELPQLYNVIKGEMSLVGPRPEVKEHTDAYDEEEQAILDIVPGMTDFSSLHFSDLGDLLGTSNAHEVYVTQVRAQKNALRLKYVRERGALTDAKILVKTVMLIGTKIFRALRASKL